MTLAENVGWPLVVVGGGLYLTEMLGTAPVALAFVAMGAVLVATAWARAANARAPDT